MKDIDTFLEEYRAVVNESGDFWENRIPARPDLPENEAWHRKQMKLINEEDTLDMIISELSGKDDFSAHQSLFSVLSRHLYKEIGTLMQGDDESIFRDVRLTFFPLSSVGAICFNRDLSDSENLSRLTGNVVVINEGLYYAVMLLVKGYIFELVEDNLKSYHHSGSKYYDWATQFYLTKDKDYSSRYSIAVNNEDHQAELSINQSLITMMIIKFVALHEVGHICHNDLELNDELKLYLIRVPDNSAVELRHDREYRADLYALKKICDLAEGDRGKWSNFLAIYLFFKWLAKVDKLSCNSFNTHPKPEKRINRLLDFMKSYVGNYEAHKEEVEWVSGMVECWEEELLAVSS